MISEANHIDEVGIYIIGKTFVFSDLNYQKT